MFLQKDGIKPNEEGYDPRTLYIPKDAWRTFTPFEVQVCVHSSHWSPFVLTSYQFWEIKQNHYDTVRSRTPINRSLVTDSVHVDPLLPERVSHTSEASRLSYRSHPFQEVLRGRPIQLSRSPHTTLICPLALRRRRAHWTPNFRPQTDFACQNVHGRRT